MTVNKKAPDGEALGKDYGDRLIKHEERKTNADFVGEADYRRIMQEARNTLPEHDTSARRRNVDIFFEKPLGRLPRD